MLRVLFFVCLCMAGGGSFSQHWRWVNHLTGGGGSHYVFDSEVGNDKNTIYFCGRYRASATFYGQNGYNVVNPPFAGSRDIFLAKTDSLGQFIWVKTIGGIDTDIAYGVTVDEFDNVYITGDYYSNFSFEGVSLTSAGSGDVFVAKFDSNGNFIWVKTMGGAGLDIGNRVVCDKNGSIYVGGSQGGGFDYGTGMLADNGYFIFKMNYSGDILWVDGPTNMTGTSSTTLNALQWHNGDIYFGGGLAGNVKFDTIQKISNGSWNDIFFAKLDSNGNAQWAHCMGSPTYDFCNDLAVTDSFIYVVGTYSGTVNFDTITRTSDQSTSGSTGALNSRDAFVAKFDSTGTCYWVVEHKSLMADEANGVFVNTNGDVVVAGSYVQSADPNLPSSVGEIRVDAYTQSGELKWELVPVGTHIGVGFSICGDQDGSIYFGGAVKDVYTFEDFSVNASSAVYSGVMAKILPPLEPSYNEPLYTCVIDTITFIVSANGGPLNYNWYSGTQTIVADNGDSLVLIFDPGAPVDSVSCIVSNGMQQDTIVFAQPNYSFPVVQLSDTTILCGISVALNAGADGEYYDWGAGLTLYDSLLTVNSEGTYYVHVVNSQGCETIDSSFVEVHTIPFLSLPDTIKTCELAIDVNAGSSGVYYDWGSGYIMYDSILTVAISGLYSVKIKDSAGCENEDSVVVFVNNCLGFINGIEGSPFLIYAYEGILYIWCENLNAYELEIINLAGQQLYSCREIYGNTQIAISQFPNGVYLVKLSDRKNGLSEVYKILR